MTDWRRIEDETEEEIARLHGENSEGMQPRQWRLMPLHGIMAEVVTEWMIFELDEEDPGSGDIVPVCGAVPFWTGLEIVRAHNRGIV